MEKNMQTTEMQEILTPVEITVTAPLGLGFGNITAPEMTDAQAEYEAQEMARFRRRIDWRNPAVCFDGRVLAEGETPLPLGAHLAGGVESVLVAARSVNYHLEDKELIEFLKSKGFTLAGHDDDTNRNSNYANGTGCGACDKCTGSCKLFAEQKEAAEPIVRAMAGPDFDKGAYDEVMLQPISVRARDIVGDELTETLHDDGKGVHGHNEIMIVLEYEDGMSFDRDAYFAETGKKVFPIQMWYLRHLADAMATGTDAPQQAREIYHALVDFQVATYIALADGSHRAAVFTPAQ